MQKLESTNENKVIRSILDLPLCKCSDQSLTCPHKLQYSSTIAEIEKGFCKGYCPKLTDDGTSGCYMLRGKTRKPVAVFKPIDEE